MQQQNAELTEFLAASSTEVIEFKGDLTELSTSLEPMDAFQIIVEKGYLSAPVYVEEDEKKEYLGFLDTRTLVSWIVFAYDERNTTPSLRDVVSSGIKMTERAIDNVTVSYLSRFHQFKPVSSNDTMLNICENLSSRCHRVPVVDNDGNLVKIITQSSVIKFLYNNRESFSGFMNLHIRDLDIGNSPVISVPTSSSTIDVFQKMDKYNISGIGIVDADGKLIGTTSGQDLKLFLKYREKASLEQPIMPFLNTIRQESLRAIVPVLVCNEEATLGEVIGRLAATRMHRIFVVDAADCPVRVISLSDILSAVFDE